jgi:hypothetical protein
MAKTILHALKQGQNTAVLLHDLEKVIKPGDRIVFLIEYRPDVPHYLLSQIGLLQTGIADGLLSEERQARLSWDEQKFWAEKNVAQSARRAFSAIGVEVEVDLYGSSLKRAVKRYLDSSEATLIYRGPAPYSQTSILLRTLRSLRFSL